jgi:hypothetical protein
VVFRLFEADVEAALISNLRLLAFLLTKGKIVIHRTVKVIEQFLYGSPFIRDQRADSLHFTVENSIAFGKFNLCKRGFSILLGWR